MNETYEQAHELRALAMRVAALEDNVAFLEEWCEEQQDILDRATRSIGCDYENAGEFGAAPRALLRIVDLRDGDGPEAHGDSDPIFAVVESEHDRKVRLIRAQLNRLRTRLAASLAPAGDGPVSAKPAGRTAP